MQEFNFSNILFISILATLVMTAFSYVVSESFRAMYKEPVLLSYVLINSKLNIPPLLKNIMGWILHFAIGFVFVLTYHFIWNNDILPENWVTALILGGISGVMGIIGWYFLFKYTEFKPQIDFKGYYLQLFFAHVLFALTAFAVYTYQ